ncbi:hypothetical protein I3700191H1_06740 [Megasphaera massiliensis]
METSDLKWTDISVFEGIYGRDEQQDKSIETSRFWIPEFRKISRQNPLGVFKRIKKEMDESKKNSLTSIRVG